MWAQISYKYIQNTTYTHIQTHTPMLIKTSSLQGHIVIGRLESMSFWLKGEGYILIWPPNERSSTQGKDTGTRTSHAPLSGEPT